MQPASHHVIVDIEVPTDVTLGQNDMQQIVRESTYIELYRRGLIGSGQAAVLLGRDRSGFLDLLSEYGFSWFDASMDVAREAKNAQP